MSNRTLRLQRADEETIAYVETLLDKNGLPSDDVEPGRNRFYIGYDGDTRVGVGGVERHGRTGCYGLSLSSDRHGEPIRNGAVQALESKGRNRRRRTVVPAHDDCGRILRGLRLRRDRSDDRSGTLFVKQPNSTSSVP